MAAQSKEAFGPRTDLDHLSIVEDKQPEPVGETVAPHPLERLRAIHVEAEQTSRLANLLGRTLYLSFLLPVLLVTALVLTAPPLTRAVSFTCGSAADSTAAC